MREPSSPKPKKLLDQLREASRIKHYSYSTEKTMSIGQSAKFSFITSAALTRCPRILAVYDDDPAGDQARKYLSSFTPLPTLGEGSGVRAGVSASRIQIISPPAHDLTDYFRPDGDLRFWLRDQLSPRPLQVLDYPITCSPLLR